MPQQLKADDPANDAQTKALLDAALDITGAKQVQVQVSRDGTVLWVNVNGVCALRACRIETLEMEHVKL